MSYFNRNKWWAIAILLLVVMNVATLTTLWLIKDKRPGPPTDPKSGVVDFLVKELGFDSVQKQKLIVLRNEHQDKIKELRKHNRDAKDAFFALLQQADTPDSVIEKAAIASTVYDKETDILTFKHFQQIRNLCTAEQKKKFENVIEEVLRMISPPRPGKQQGPPLPRREGDRPDGPPPGDDGHRGPPPPQE